ncbi:MAG: hypothetical protein HY690_17695 [Chloroflexi bacterium]|nr:hypothetical protein [Chloroflexota bacterium]
MPTLMYRNASPSWTRSQLRKLFADYFGDRLSPAQLEALVSNVAAALADRGGGIESSPVPARRVVEQPPEPEG